MQKSNIVSILDKSIFICLILYSLTFLFNYKFNFFVCAFILGLIKLIFIRPKIEIYSKHLHFIFIFIFCIFISVLINPDASLSSFKSRFISPLVCLLLIFLFQFTNKRTIIIISGFALSLCLNGAVVILQFLQNDFPYLHTRLVGFSTQHYMFICGTNLLILPIILTLSLYKSKLPIKLRLFYFITILINIPAVIFEETRIVWLGLLIIFPLIIFLSIRNKIQAFSLVILLTLYSFFCFQISPQLTQRFESISSVEYKTQSNYERILMWQSAIKMFLDHPITGVGIENYHHEYISKYQSPLSREDQYQPHNLILYILSESGIMGGVPLIAMFIYFYYKILKESSSTNKLLSIIAFSVLFSFNINFFTDSPFCVTGVLRYLTYIFWFYIGIYLVLNKYIIISYDTSIK